MYQHTKRLIRPPGSRPQALHASHTFTPVPELSLPSLPLTPALSLLSFCLKRSLQRWICQTTPWGPFVDVSIYWALSTLPSRTVLCGTQFCSLPICIHLPSKNSHIPTTIYPITFYSFPCLYYLHHSCHYVILVYWLWIV